MKGFYYERGRKEKENLAMCEKDEYIGKENVFNRRGERHTDSVEGSKHNTNLSLSKGKSSCQT
jgi:hypothetical protein